MVFCEKGKGAYHQIVDECVWGRGTAMGKLISREKSFHGR